MLIVKVSAINAPGRPDGCEQAPDKILESLKQIHSSEKGRLIDEAFEIKEISVDNKNIQETQDLIYKNAKKIFSGKEKVIFIGGDHSISYPLVKAFYKANENPFLIIFDAHPDLMPSMKEPTHEEWLCKLVEEKFPVSNILLVGLRNSDKEEIKFIKNNAIKTIDINLFFNDLEEITDNIMELANKHPIYLSVDIDAIDPAFAPGTSYCEPGGLTSRQIIYIAQRLSLLKNLKAIDITEVNPLLDHGETQKLAARLIAELI